MKGDGRRDARMRELTNAHTRMFRQMNVDSDTGMIGEPHLKFGSYPHIGSCYGKMRQVLIVGMDIGGDPRKGRIHSYEQRCREIEDKPPGEHNPHMSGTYITAMRFLQSECGEWRRWLKRADKERVPQSLLSKKENLPHRNPLRYIAFTNDYKFLLVHNGQKVRIDHDEEQRFLVEEARILDPDIIVFQSAGFWRRSKLLRQMSEIAEVFVGNHPSAWGRRQRLGNFLDSIRPWPQ